MPKIAVHIRELPPGHGGEVPPGEVPRSDFWFGEAEDEDAARQAAYASWERRYGPDHPPRCPIEVISILDGVG
jgi:hypothetical protein